MHPLETYLNELSEIHGSGAGVKETSYYPVLRTLLNDIGKTLKPKVRCIIHLQSKGAGIPDGGLFSADQLRGLGEEKEALEGQLPARAVLEAKGTSDEVDTIAESAQVAKYLSKYGLVLVTNYRDFRLVTTGPRGEAVKLEAYHLADKEKDFWALAAHPQKAASEQGERLADYLRRVMLTRAPLTKPEDVAWFLASYAREALAHVEAGDLLTLAAIRATLEETLGLKFEGDKGEHFFRSTLVQTLFYGIFSAWVLWHGENPARQDAFDWRTAAYYLRVPIIQALFEEVADPKKLRALGLMEVLGWAGDTLSRVNRDVFFASFEQGHAVQYFYEPFLEAFDPELRKDLGVWYTPPEIVQYMVARVDAVLRQELDIPDGLADPRVLVLDPCAGTGAYLVEVLKRIAATLRENGEGALLAGEVKRAARERIFGFELLPAPYVVAHLQLGLLLQSLGAPLADGERAAMYLTNSLTGWEPPKEPKTQLRLFEELAAERDAAEKVKREAKILVVIGNPPYNAFAGTSPAEEQGLVEPYKAGLISEWGIKKFNLDDLYVRFFRLAERRIAEQTGRGVVCFISNFSYLSDPSFVVMRQRLLSEFDAFWFDCLNGDSRETGKLTPEGKPDPSVFSTPFNHEGIRVGTAIGLMVRRTQRASRPTVGLRQYWGITKRADLLNSLAEPDLDSHYLPAAPEKSNRYSFRADDTSREYLSWPKVAELSGTLPFNGPIERRGNSLIVFESDKADLALLATYLDPQMADKEVSVLAPRFMKSAGEFKGEKTRAMLKGKVKYDEGKIARYPFKPFDVRLAYLDNDIQPLFSRPSPELLENRLIPDNAFLLTRDTADKSPEGPPFYFSRVVCDYDCIAGHARHFPTYLRHTSTKKDSAQLSMLNAKSALVANLSGSARAYLTSLGLPNPDTDSKIAALVWMHTLAIGYSLAYLSENADGIRGDWPRVPLPKSKEGLLASATLGKQVAALLDTESPMAGVTVGAIRSELKNIAVVQGPTPLNLSVTAGWGSAGREGVTMPGKGRRVEREPEPAERVTGLGEKTHDIYLNDDVYWRNVPERVWDYTIGGYQVMKKWLSYREEKLLGRPITQDEAREVSHMARRIAAILLLEPALDANYAAVKAAAYAWPRAQGAASSTDE